MSEQPTPGTHAWEAWANEVRMEALVARLRAQQRRVQLPPERVRSEARARGERVAALEAKYRQLDIRERGPE